MNEIGGTILKISTNRGFDILISDFDINNPLIWDEGLPIGWSTSNAELPSLNLDAQQIEP